jgi:hypothetical protein
MSAESPLKSKKIERREVELPSQNEMENLPIPDEPLSWEFLQQLHGVEEFRKLIKERHCLNLEELFKHVPSSENPSSKFDQYYLLKIALFRLESINWTRITDFFDLEFHDYGKTDLYSVISIVYSKYFTNKLKNKITKNSNDIDFTVKRQAEMYNCRNLVNDICLRTSLPINRVFSRPFQKPRYSDVYDFEDLCQYFLQSITRSSDVHLSDKRTPVIGAMVVKYFSKEARAFFLQNITKARNEARKKAVQQAGK